MNNDTHIILDKELRRDIDAIIQRLKNPPHTDSGYANISAPSEPRDPNSKIPDGFRRSRERSIVVTKLQEAVMWLGMDLKAINEENQPAEDAIEAAAEVIYGQKYDTDEAGKKWPWVDGGNSTKQDEARREARLQLSPSPNPYPNSKDPTNTVIDKTADGLKL